MTDFLPFALPDIGDDEINEVVKTMRSGWLTTGPVTRRFEADFAAFLGGNLHAIGVNSATSGLHLALEAIGVGPGDEVLMPSLTFTATAEVVRYLGADPVFVDIDPRTLNIDPSKLSAAITPRTKAIIPVHFAGLACDMGAILQVAKAKKLRVIEDAAHSFPTMYKGKLVGTLDSDVTVFSFYATKTLATGEGGMVVTRDAKIAERCKIMRLHGISRDAFDRYTSRSPSWYYEVVAPGYKYNLTDVASSIGIHQLRRARELATRREELARQYDEALAALPVRLPPRGSAPGEHAHHLYALQLAERAPVKRDKFIELMAEAGIACSVHFIPLHMHPYWRDRYKLSPEAFPETLRYYERAVSLPLYTKMSDQDSQRVISAVKKILN